MLYVVATPIGNLEDVSLRALEVLKKADIIACEDTRQSAKLLAHYNVHSRLVSYHQHSARKTIDFLLGELAKQKNVAVISDGGTPGISDPGFLLVKAALDSGFGVTAVPGASAVIDALSISGLPTDGFVFLGFLPRKHGKMKKELLNAGSLNKTIVFYESPYRLQDTLEVLAEVYGENISVAVARELTKKFEEIIRGKLREVITAVKDKKILGECTVVFNTTL